MIVISVEFIKLVFVSFWGVGLDFSKPLNELFVLNLRNHLGNGNVEGGKTRLGWQGGVRGCLSLILCLASRSDLLFYISSLL